MLELIKEKAVAALIAAIVSAAVGAIIAWFTAKKNKRKNEIDDIKAQLKRHEENDELLKAAIKTMLRQEIISAYDKYTRSGWAKVYIKDNVQEMYDCYHALGGNGTITHLVEEFMDLPTREEDSLG